MLAITVERQQDRNKLVLTEVAEPIRGPGHVLVSVESISLNHGEVQTAFAGAPAGARPGWEYAGTVLQADADSRFASGDRIVGLMHEGAWAERVAAPEPLATLIPEGVEQEAAVTLPVAGLTAALALSKKKLGVGDRVLVTASVGSVGRLAIMLAVETGAHVTAYIRKREQDNLVRSLGAHDVLHADDDFDAIAPFDLVLEGVGGPLLAKTMTHLASEGICVLFGNAAHGEETRFDPDAFRLRQGTPYGGTVLYGFFLGNELARVAAAPLLANLLEKLRLRQLSPTNVIVGNWREADTIAQAVFRGELNGRAVLKVS